MLKKMRGVLFFFFTCVYFASGSKCGLSTPLTSGELAGGKLVLFIALHSSSLALEKDGLSLTGGQKRDRKEERKVSGGLRKDLHWRLFSCIHLAPSRPRSEPCSESRLHKL